MSYINQDSPQCQVQHSDANNDDSIFNQYIIKSEIKCINYKREEREEMEQNEGEQNYEQERENYQQEQQENDQSQDENQNEENSQQQIDMIQKLKGKYNKYVQKEEYDIQAKEKINKSNLKINELLKQKNQEQVQQQQSFEQNNNNQVEVEQDSLQNKLNNYLSFTPKKQQPKVKVKINHSNNHNQNNSEEQSGQAQGQGQLKQTKKVSYFDQIYGSTNKKDKNNPDEIIEDQNEIMNAYNANQQDEEEPDIFRQLKSINKSKKKSEVLREQGSGVKENNKGFEYDDQGGQQRENIVIDSSQQLSGSRSRHDIGQGKLGQQSRKKDLNLKSQENSQLSSDEKHRNKLIYNQTNGKQQPSSLKSSFQDGQIRQPSSSNNQSSEYNYRQNNSSIKRVSSYEQKNHLSSSGKRSQSKIESGQQVKQKKDKYQNRKSYVFNYSNQVEQSSQMEGSSSQGKSVLVKKTKQNRSEFIMRYQGGGDQDSSSSSSQQELRSQKPKNQQPPSQSSKNLQFLIKKYQNRSRVIKNSQIQSDSSQQQKQSTQKQKNNSNSSSNRKLQKQSQKLDSVTFNHNRDKKNKDKVMMKQRKSGSISDSFDRVNMSSLQEKRSKNHKNLLKKDQIKQKEVGIGNDRQNSQKQQYKQKQKQLQKTNKNTNFYRTKSNNDMISKNAIQPRSQTNVTVKINNLYKSQQKGMQSQQPQQRQQYLSENKTTRIQKQYHSTSKSIQKIKQIQNELIKKVGRLEQIIRELKLIKEEREKGRLNSFLKDDSSNSRRLNSKEIKGFYRHCNNDQSSPHQESSYRKSSRSFRFNNKKLQTNYSIHQSRYQKDSSKSISKLQRQKLIQNQIIQIKERILFLENQIRLKKSIKNNNRTNSKRKNKGKQENQFQQDLKLPNKKNKKKNKLTPKDSYEYYYNQDNNVIKKSKNQLKNKKHSNNNNNEYFSNKLTNQQKITPKADYQNLNKNNYGHQYIDNNKAFTSYDLQFYIQNKNYQQKIFSTAPNKQDSQETIKFKVLKLYKLLQKILNVDFGEIKKMKIERYGVNQGYYYVGIQGKYKGLYDVMWQFKKKKMIQDSNKDQRSKWVLYCGQVRKLSKSQQYNQVNRIKQGQGIQLSYNSYIYRGYFRNNLKEGPGFINFNNGDIYYGSFAHDQIHGNGIYLTFQGDVYEGNFQYGVKSGYGKEKFRNGDMYKGMYKLGAFQGQGKYKWKNGSSYEGEFRKGLLHGKGLWKSGKGDAYEGQYYKNKKHGFGVYKWKNGRVFQGRFVDGVRQDF